MKTKVYIRSPGVYITNDPLRGLRFQDCGQQIFWEKDLLIIEEVISIMMFCAMPKTYRNIKEFFKLNYNHDDATIDKIINKVIDLGILVEEQKTKDFIESAYLQWIKHGWEDAFYFHLNTNNLKKIDYYDDPRDEKDRAMMRRYLSEESPPSNYKNYNSHKKITLVTPEKDQVEHKDFNTLNSMGGEESKYEKKNLGLKELTWLLYICFGQTFTRHMQETGEHVAKTSPSGGSRHPTEIYPLILNWDDVQRGLYHYSVENHSLELLTKNEADIEKLKKNLLLYSHKHKNQPQIIFIMTSIFERSMFRYRESRSYRVMHFDIGHILMTTSLLAESIGLKSSSFYSMNEEEISKTLGIDGLTEAPMAFMTLG